MRRGFRLGVSVEQHVVQNAVSFVRAVPALEFAAQIGQPHGAPPDQLGPAIRFVAFVRMLLMARLLVPMMLMLLLVLWLWQSGRMQPNKSCANIIWTRSINTHTHTSNTRSKLGRRICDSVLYKPD